MHARVATMSIEMRIYNKQLYYQTSLKETWIFRERKILERDLLYNIMMQDIIFAVSRKRKILERERERGKVEKRENSYLNLNSIRNCEIY